MMRILVRFVTALLLLIAPSLLVAQNSRVPLNAASTFSLGTGPPTVNLQAWYKADALQNLSPGQGIKTWYDSGPLGHNAVQATTANQPTYQPNVANGAACSTCLPVVRFAPNVGTPANSQFLNLGNYNGNNAVCTAAGTPNACCSGPSAGTCGNATCTAPATPFSCCTGSGTGTCGVPLTSGEIFIVIKLKNDLPSPPDLLHSGLWRFTDNLVGNGNNFAATHYPFYQDDLIYESFGTGTRYGGFSHPLNLATAFRVYNVSSAASGTPPALGWSARLNLFNTLATSSTNTVNFSSATTLGQSHGGSADPTDQIYLDGDVAEVLFYGATSGSGGVLTATDRNAVTSYLSAKYALAISGATPSCSLILNDTTEHQGQYATRDCDGDTTEGFFWPLQWMPNMPTSGTIRFDVEAVPLFDNTQCSGSGAPFACCTGIATGTCNQFCLQAALGCADGFFSPARPARDLTYGTTEEVCQSDNEFAGAVYSTVSFSSANALPIPSLTSSLSTQSDRSCGIIVTRDGLNGSDTSPGIVKVRAGRLIF